MSNHIKIGEKGEKAALVFLIKTGYKILETNWRYKKYEIDIIAQKNDELVIIEVKSRTGTYFELPFEAVTKKKQANIICATEAYIEKYNIDLETRFDIISIVFENENPKIDHIEDAFYPLVN